MDIVKLNIPYVFLRNRTRLNWRSVRFGLQNELIDPMVARELAMNQIAATEAPSSVLLDLASEGREASVAQLVERLAEHEPECLEERLHEEWLYLVLVWIYEHREGYSDPLQKVEEVYADFGYPERIAAFVRYMPMDGPDIGSRRANEDRLFERWRQYLNEARRKASFLS